MTSLTVIPRLYAGALALRVLAAWQRAADARGLRRWRKEAGLS